VFVREDFFLISQHVRQGTVSPTHYIVVADTSSLKIDHIQQITYRMTHMYYNWPGTVRVPAPCQVCHAMMACRSDCGDTFVTGGQSNFQLPSVL